VERAVADAIRACGVLPGAALTATGRLPEGAAAILAPAPGGACPAFDSDAGNLCAIQRRLGHEGLPAACRHFPRVALIEPDAVRVTLSHFCPTAAWMLFRRDVARPAAVPDAAGISDRPGYEGFDARGTIPPLLRPGVAMDAATCRLWEEHLLDTLDAAALPAAARVAGVALAAEELRGWSAGSEPLEAHARGAFVAVAARVRFSSWSMPFAAAARLFRLAADSVPPGLTRPGLPEGAEAADLAAVMPHWASCSRPVGRYLAARSFGAWSAYLGEGVRTQAAMLAMALAVVRVEAVRESARAGRLDDARLHAAIRSADLLLYHLADTQALVKSQAAVEQGTTSVFLGAIGLEAPA
jgi:hypothetical protein